MKLLFLLLSIISFNCFSHVSKHVETSKSAVTETVNYYLKGSVLGDSQMISKAFHSDALVQGNSDGKIQRYDMKTFLGFFSTDKPGKHTTKIISIDIDIENDAALVKAHWDMGTWKYIDYLTLLKNNDQWKIVNKVYTKIQK